MKQHPIDPTYEYCKVRLLGTEGVLIDRRIDLADPALEGLFTAGLRHDEYDWTEPVEVCRFAPLANHMGTFVSATPIVPCILGSEVMPWLYLEDDDFAYLDGYSTLSNLKEAA